MSRSKKESPSRARRRSSRVDREVPEAFADKLQALRSSDRRSFDDDRAELGLPPKSKYTEDEKDLVIAKAGHLRADRQIGKLDRVRELLLSAFAGEHVQMAIRRVLGENETLRLLTVTRDLTVDEWKPCPKGCGHFLLEHKVTGGCTRQRGVEPCGCDQVGFHGKIYDPLAKPAGWTAQALRMKKHKRKLAEFEKRAKDGDEEAQRLVDEVHGRGAI
jgi:hypothetical protein